MANLRYTKSSTFPYLSFANAVFSDDGNLTTDGLRTMRPANGWTRAAPSRYSNVQKVVFHAALQWLENNAARNIDVRLMVGPMSTSNTTRVIHAKQFALASLVKSTVGQTTPWAFEPYNTVNTNFQNTMLYGKRGVQATLNGAYTGIGTEADVHVFTITFDRSDPEAADFWADWDMVAAVGDDDVYVGYNIYPGIVESTFVAGTSTNMFCPSFGFHVVQAPGLQNDTCTIVDASRLAFYTPNLAVARRTAFSVQPDEHLGRWAYNSDQWDGITQVTMWNQGCAGVIGSGQFGRFRVDVAPNPGTAITTLDQQNFDNLSGTVRMDIIRSADVKDLLPDGGFISGDYLFEGVGGNNTGAPLQQIEIVQKFATKSVYYMFLGRGAGNPASSYPSVAGHSYFDPAFFNSFPSRLISARSFEGTVRREVMGELTQYYPRTDEDLGSHDANPDTSATAVSVTPFQVNSSGNDDDDPQVLFQQYSIGAGDPFDLLTPRKTYLRTTVSTTGVNDCGWAYLAYAHAVPNSDATQELGPLFQVGSFDPEGCVSTSAGLGDNPGVLVLTNGTSTPKKFDPRAMVIENAGIDVPYSGEEPSSATASVALSPVGGLTPGIYTYRYTLRNCCTGKESDPNPVDIVVDGSGESPGLEVTLNFSGVLIPADPQICEICVYRTILGGDFPVMAKVGCFDPDTATVFVDIVPDDELDFINDSLSILNAPMPCVAVVAEFRNRLWGLVDIPNLNPPGTVSATNGSDVLDGDVDTEFSRCVIGKFIQIQGDCTAYEVTALLLPTSGTSPLTGYSLQLDREYEGVTDSGLSYTICGHPNRLYISEPLEPECWPGVNFLDVDPGDGDRLMGAVSNFNRLLICKIRKTYVVAFSVQPVTEINVPTLISSDIGCIAPRTFAQVAVGSVWLSDRGLVLYNGGSVQSVKECSVMNDLFVNPDNPNYLRRDSIGRAVGAAGVFYPKREQYLCLLPTKQTTRGANLLLVWDTELRNVTLLEFCQEFLAIEVAKDSDGNERVYLGDANGFVWIWDVGDTDGVGFPNATGTVRGTITAAGIEESSGASFLDDSTATFIVGGVPGIADLSGISGLSGLTGNSNMGLAGVCVFWRPANSPLGTPWKSKTIYTSTTTRLYVTPNWAGETPSVGDEYMIGPIRFEAEFKPANYGTDDFTKRDWRQVIVHEPEDVSTNLRVELLRDFQNSDVDEDTVTDSDGATGEGRTFDLGFGYGRQVRPVGRLVHEYMGVRLTNFAPDEPLTILNHLLMMNPRTSK